MKYKIILGGRGSDVWVHRLTEEQKEKLYDGGVEEDMMDVDEICEVLGVENLDQTDEVYGGPYLNDKNFTLEVFDETGKKVWDSYNGKESYTEKEKEEFWDFDMDLCEQYDYYEIVADDNNILLVEDYQKGEWRQYEIETDLFDPNQITPIVKEVGERIPIITGLCYEGKELETKDWLDTTSKGFYYHLNLEI